ALADTIRALANYGSQRKYVFRYKGINSRMSEMDAALLSVKLKYIDQDNDKRRRLAAYYYDNISNPLITLPQRIPDAYNVYHQFPVFCKHRDELQAHMREHGVETLIHYPIPPHKQECYKEWHSRSYPITERIHAQELSIPMSPVVTDDEARTIVNALNGFTVHS
ncbi:MAG: DegT/DnrJ/EryC1/StrS family aminotransferase, partial [Prevotella sp.]|nr:DegT/DnrJ/EryC1/StrS family aminotransferase [Prevotella sp.]